jgi:hypothetical protein
MKLENQNILIVSNEPWGNFWYSKHNYAWQFSKKNKVYFLNPPGKFSLFNVFNNKLKVEKITDSLFSITYKNILPVKINVLRRINEWYILNKLRRWYETNQVKDVLFWTFDPIRLSSPEQLKPAKVVLHAVDHYLFTYPSESILSRKADCIICVSDIIAKSYRNYSDNVYVIPHAIPDDEFLPVKAERSGNLNGIFVGTIDERLDFQYTAYIAQKFPEVHFKFIGKTTAPKGISVTLAYKNISFESEKPFSELKNFIREADFCFLFKDLKHPGNNISSHKMLQYFAQGKPIFSTKLEQYSKICDLLYMENDKEKMAEIMDNYFRNSEDSSLVQKRIDYAKQHSFNSTIDKIEKLLG